MGLFDGTLASPTGEGPKAQRIMIRSTHLKAHRSAASLLKKDRFPVVLAERRVG